MKSDEIPATSTPVDLERSAPSYKFALETAGIGLWEYNLETGMSVWDDVTKQCFGVEAAEKFPLDAGLSLIHPDDRERVEQTLQDALDPDSGGDYRVEKRIIRPDGETRWIRTTGRAIFEGSGEQRRATRVIGIVQDITDERRAARAEQRLARAGVKLASTLDYNETLRDVATVSKQFFADHCVISIIEQDGFEKQRELGTVGAASDDVVELLRESSFFDPEETEIRQICERESLLVSGANTEILDVLNAEFESIVAEDRPFVSSLIAVPLTPRGQFLGYMWFLCTAPCDVYSEGDLVLAEQLAVRAALAADNARLYTRAREAIRTRDEMQAVIVHDLRNPLTIIRGMEGVLEIKMVEGTVDADCLRRHLRVQKRAIEQMEHLIKNLYDAVALEAGTYRLDCAPEDPATIVEEALDLAWLHGQNKELEVDSRVAEGLPEIYADRQAVMRVASNLVHNAVKFTPPRGRVVISATHGEGVVEFRVQDTGPGIPEEIVPHIFERYWQARRGEKRGSGLGLAISREIVSEHAGQMWVENNSGTGATVAFSIPIADVE